MGAVRGTTGLAVRHRRKDVHEKYLGDQCVSDGERVDHEHTYCSRVVVNLSS